MSTMQLSPFSLIEQAIEQKNVEALFTIPHEDVRREDLDRIEVTDENSDMVSAAKFVWSLRKVQQLEGMALDQIISQETNDLQMLMWRALKDFKHLITVPNRNAMLSAHPECQQVYQQAFKDSQVILNEELLEKIYTIAWSNVNFPNTQFNLAIIEPHSDFNGLPNAAIEGICKGVIRPHDIIEGISLPISIDDHQLQRLCETLKGKQVNILCLSLQQGIPEASLAMLMDTIVSAQMKMVMLNGIPEEYCAAAQAVAQQNHIQLYLGRAYWQNIPSA